MKLHVTMDGAPRVYDTAPGENLRDLLQREGHISVRDGCNGEGACGACTVVVDKEPMNACLLKSMQVEGKTLETVAGLAPVHEFTPLQTAFVDAGVVQCGYCTPAMLLATNALLDRIEAPTRQEVQDALSGVFCRCTGYEQIFNAIELARKRMVDPQAKNDTAPEFRDDLRHIGKLRTKVDGPHLSRGGAAFVDDRVRPGTCHMKVLRSPVAHAYIANIDTSKAEALPGVVHILTHRNVPDIYYNQGGQGFPEPSPYDRKLIGEKVLHVGDRVAAVIAESLEVAEQALKLIEVEYEELAPVLTIDDAKAPGAAILHNGIVEYVVGEPEGHVREGADPREGKVIYQFPIHGDPRRNVAASVSGGIGDLDKGFAEADVVLERTYDVGQIQCTPVEPHVVYTFMENERLVMHASTQVPYHVRRIVASLLQVPENRIRVIKERTGGAFGSKQDIVLEELAAYATWVTGRPVLFRFTREEEFISSRTRHPMRIHVKLGAKRDGTMTAVTMNVEANTGPYGSHCLTVPMNACSKSLPLFLCDNMQFDVKTYYTNIPPTGAYQGYGAPKGNFALQMAAAEMAAEIGMDQLAFLEKNRVRDGVMLEILRCLGEGREGTPQRVSSCGLAPALEQGAALVQWGESVESDDPDVKIGKGLALVQQGSGLPGLDSANATVAMFGDGTFMLLSGAADLGTGLDTVTTKMVAEVLCTPMSAISVLSGDTDTTPFDVGAYASSGTYFSGGAARNAGRKMKEQLLEAAADMLSEPVADLELEYPGLVRGKKGSVTYEQIARETQSGTGRGQLTATAHFITEDASFPYGAHFAQVAVNTRTGAVRIQRYHALQDSGTPINPELTQGQIYGGVLKTIGSAMYEEMILDESGVCLNPTLLGYKVPMIGDLPDEFGAHLIYTNDPFGPFGAKSVAEISCNGAAPAIATAIHAACGVWLRAWPFTPEKVLAALGKL